MPSQHESGPISLTDMGLTELLRTWIQLQSKPEERNAEMKPKAKQAMKAFAETTTLRQAIDHIKCGLEFEFNGLNGYDNNERSIDGSDSDDDLGDRMYEDASSLWQDRSIDENFSDTERQASNPDMNAIIRKTNGDFYHQMFTDKVELRTAVLRYYQNVRDRQIEDIADGLDASDYRSDSGSWSDELNAPSEIDHMIEFVEDSSVNGAEIRTIGGRTIPEFLKVAKFLSTKDFEVGVNTSFHIHLSVNNVEHTYGQRFQAEMYAYILKNWKRLPRSVQDRIVHRNGGQQWAAFVNSNSSKYCAIHKHEQGTWEFRLFGNIQDYKEMSRCLSMAVEAMRHAYRVKLGMTKSLLKGAHPINITKAFELASDRPAMFFNVLKEMQEQYSVEIEAIAA